MRITETILTGNCGDATYAEIERYADLVRAEFAEQFPNADVTVILAGGSGSGPATLVEFDEGDEHDGHAEFVASQVARMSGIAASGGAPNDTKTTSPSETIARAHS